CRTASRSERASGERAAPSGRPARASRGSSSRSSRCGSDASDRSPDLEADDRALLQAVRDGRLALDAMRLPVVGARGVEPELRVVEELRLVGVDAAVLVRLADAGAVADDALLVLLGRLADVDPHLPRPVH